MPLCIMNLRRGIAALYRIFQTHLGTELFSPTEHLEEVFLVTCFGNADLCKREAAAGLLEEVKCKLMLLRKDAEAS